MRHALQCLPDCDGWPCTCPCHDDPPIPEHDKDQE